MSLALCISATLLALVGSIGSAVAGNHNPDEVSPIGAIPQDQMAQLRLIHAAANTVAADLYVATDGNDASSSQLATANPERTDGPLATIETAQQRGDTEPAKGAAM